MRNCEKMSTAAVAYTIIISYDKAIRSNSTPHYHIETKYGVFAGVKGELR